MSNPGEIEISFTVEVSASLAFWIDKADWDPMPAEQRKALVVNHLESAALMLSDSPVQYCDVEPGLQGELFSGDICAEISDVDMDKLSVYNPEGE
jgi:hypothetical protein